MRAEIRYPAPEDRQDIGPWVDGLIQYVKDIQEETENPFSDLDLTPDREFMLNVLAYMSQWDVDYN